MKRLPPWRPPYPADALEPYLGEQAVELHYALTKRYIIHANLQASAQERGRPVNRQRARFDHNGARLHMLWWDNLVPTVPGKSRRIPRRVLAAFGGNARALKEAMVTAGQAVEGSGWVALAWNKRKKRAEVITFPNHKFPWNHYVPLLLLDVWEHSYICEYGSDRCLYLEEVWKLINWAEVERRLG